MNKSTESSRKAELEFNTSFHQVILKYLAIWPWIIVCAIVCVGLAYTYNRYSAPKYKISARVLINDEKKGGGMMGGQEILNDLGGLLGGKSTVDNEAEILKTRFLMERVVQDMKLNITYFKEGHLNNIEIYKAPFIVNPVKLLDTIPTTHVNVSLAAGDKILFSVDKLDTIIEFNKIVQLPKVGSIQILKNPDVPDSFHNYGFTITSVDSKVKELMSNLEVGVSNKLVTVIDLTLNYSVPKKGEDILNRLIYNYVQSNLGEKNEVADSTIAFIKRRLLIISNELGDAEGNIQGFKQKNKLADMSEQGKLLVLNTGQYANDLAKVETQITIINSLIASLNESGQNRRVLPSSLMPDMVFSRAMEKYNSLLLERGRKLIGLTESNPMILTLDKEIANAMTDIEANLKSTLDGLIITRNKLNSQINGAEVQVKQVPETERNYLKLARQQQIKQELYIFLMQKSEETAISKTANISNSKTIDPPKSDIVPYAPKKPNIYALSLALGMLIPLSVFYVVDSFNTKVESKGDVVKHTSVPIVGEISHNEGNDSLVVANSSRSAISEQFRALRTNLSFFFKSKSDNIILLTSSMAGEGKSFAAINLGNILALSDKKVLLMELDLRKPGLSAKLELENHIGFTNYIIDPELKISDIIRPLKIHENLSLISSGPIPPNPAEMLLSPRTNDLIGQLKSEFDYIIIDAPPIGVVTDAQLLSSVTDVCLYLVRQKYTNKDQLKIVQDLYNSDKMKNIGIVVNDIQTSRGYGYGYGYGDYGAAVRTQRSWKFWRK